MLKAVLILCLSFVHVSLGDIFINEVDANQPGADNAEFIELYNSGYTDVVLDDYSVVLFNGAFDPAQPYATISLAGSTIPARGYLVIAKAGFSPTPDVVTTANVQNGADAIGLYTGDVSGITVATTTNLVDAIAYSTGADTRSPFVPELIPDQALLVDDYSVDQSITRCSYNGVSDHSEYIQEFTSITPGAQNPCSVEPTTAPPPELTTAPPADSSYSSDSSESSESDSSS